jgi:serine/threonine-protein kinase HipA
VDPVDEASRRRREITDTELEEWAAGAPAIPYDSGRSPRLSLAGAQHKVTVRLTESGYALPGADEPSTHILKFTSADFPHLTANEYLTTQFASELGLQVVDLYLDDRTDPPFLVVERYDRVSPNGSVSRIHQEDFCQALGYLPSRKYEADGGPGLSDLARIIRQVSSRPAADVLALVRWTLFCAIAGNADGHAKNLSLLYGRSGPTLSPHYDLVCTRAYPKLHPYLAFSVAGERDPDRILVENWERFARDIGVRPRLVIRELERVLSDADDAFERACEHLREKVGASHAVQHVGPAVTKRVRAIASHLRRDD